MKKLNHFTGRGGFLKPLVMILLLGAAGMMKMQACNVIFKLGSSDGTFGGWNGYYQGGIWSNSLIVTYEDGSSESFTVPEGSYHASYTREIPHGSHIVLTWSYYGPGYNTQMSQCFFALQLENGAVIYEIGSMHDPTYHQELDIDCDLQLIKGSVVPVDGGAVAGYGTYPYGETCTLTATPNDGYVFDHWTENGEVASLEDNYSFQVETCRNLVAHFVPCCETNLEFVLYGTQGTASWEGSHLVVTYSNGYSEQLAVESGTMTSYVRRVAQEGRIALSWIAGSYADQCSFRMQFENGVVICENEAIAPDFHFEFDMDCDAAHKPPLTSLFEDFNDGVIDSGFWDYQDVVVEEDGLIQLEGGNILMNKQVGFPESGKIFISRNYFMGDGEFKIRFNLDDNLYLRFYRNYANLCVEAKMKGVVMSRIVCDGFDNLGWYSEKIVIDVLEGTLSYYNGNRWLSTLSIPRLASYDISRFDLQFSGEEHKMDYLSINADENQRYISCLPNIAEDGYITGAGYYSIGQTCTVTANPPIGHYFVNWTENGEVVSMEAAYSFQISESRNLVANYHICSHVITANANPSELGTVSEGTAVYEYGETCTLVATPTEGYTVYWTENDSMVWAKAEYSFTVTSDRDLEAHFVLPFSISALALEGGSISGVGIYYSGDTCTLVATPDEGFSFCYWKENGIVLSGSPILSFEVCGDRSLEALFTTDEGMLGGLFSFSENKQAYFSKGNLQYIGTAYEPYYKFAEYQYDYLGNEIFGDKHGDADIFGTSAGAWFSEENAIANGGNTPWNWKRLRSEEWDYLVNTRETQSGIRFAKAQVNGINGLILLPDVWDTTAYYLANGNVKTAAYNSNVISELEWNSLELAGAVFLPAAGWENRYYLYQYGERGAYNANDRWMYYGLPIRRMLTFNNSALNAMNSGEDDYMFCSDRLVRPNCVITVSADLEEKGTASGAGAYLYGTTCTLTATANEGYTFLFWTKNDVVVSTDLSYSFIAKEDAEFVANFVEESDDDDCRIVFDLFGTNSWTHNYYRSFYLVVTDDNGVSRQLTLYSPENHTTATLTLPYPSGTHLTLSWFWVGDVNWNDTRTFTVSFENGDVIFEGDYRDLPFEFDACEFTSYTITASINPSESGSVEGTGEYGYGTTCTLTAVPNEGKTFCCWSRNGDIVSTDSIYSFRVTNDRTLEAYFGEDTEQCLLVFDCSGFGGYLQGGVQFTFSDCSPSKSLTSSSTFTVRSGTHVTMEWTGSHIDQTFALRYENNAIIYQGSLYNPFFYEFDINCQDAYFSCDITAVANSEEGGTVGGAGEYDFGSTCTLTAIPNEGYFFSTWTKNGQIVSCDSEYSFTVEEDCTLVANFVEKDCELVFDLFDSAGDGWRGNSINVIFDDGRMEEIRIRFGSTGRYSFPISGTTHVIISNERSGYWQGEDLAVIGECSFTVSYESGLSIFHCPALYKNYHEEFDVSCEEAYTPHVINATVNLEEGGTVAGMGTYNTADYCTLTATPNESYNFLSWTKDGEEVSTEAAYSFRVIEDVDYVANFGLKYFVITTVANPNMGGAVSGSGAYEIGTEATVTATANGEYIFENWTKNGEVVSNSLTYSFSVTETANYVANFHTGSHEIVVAASPSDCGTAIGAGIYDHGTTATLTATANEGYAFTNWMKDGVIVSTDATYSFDVTKDATYCANFKSNASNNALQVFSDYYPDPEDSSESSVRVYWEQIVPIEDFESGDFSMFDWQLDEDYPWTITTKTPYEGRYCIKSGNKGIPNTSSSLEIEMDILIESVMSFRYKISSESNCDLGRFYIDDEEMFSCSGVDEWKNQVFTIPAGLHVFRWDYTKDGNVNSNEDGFYLDYISLVNKNEASNLTQDFENGLGDWTVIDADNDGWTWTLRNDILYTWQGYNNTPWYHSGSNAICSASYLNGVGPLTPDEYLISPQVTLDNNSQLSFWVAAVDPNYPADHFGVFVSNTGTELSDFTSVQEWTLTAKKGAENDSLSVSRDEKGLTMATWYNYTVDLGAYAGSAYIAFRHFNCTDQYIMCLDDISLSSGMKSTCSNHNVYRERCEGGEMQLLVDNWTEEQYIDTTWADLPNGSYRYGISSSQDGGNIIIWANCIDKADHCIVKFQLHDSYGDGWTGNNLVVSYGNTTRQLTIEVGYSASYLIPIPQGNHVTLSWIEGNYPEDCSFTVSYENNNTMIYQSNSLGSNTYEFDVDCDFPTYEITALVNPEGCGSLTGGGVYYEGVVCTLTATPVQGFHFSNWTCNDTVVATTPSYSFTVTDDAVFVAHFVPGIILGEGTNTSPYLPSFSGFEYTLSQQIYTSSEIGIDGNITHLSFFNDGSTKTRNYNIYMVHTDKTTFESTTDWIVVTEADLVFSGTVTLSQDGWSTIALDAPFPYNGFSNLALVVDDNSGYEASSPQMECRIYNAGGRSALRIHSTYNDFDPYNPSSYNGVLSWQKNQIILGFDFGSYAINATVNPIEGGTVSGVGSYIHGATCVLAASAHTGYSFVNWTKDGEEVSTSATYTFTVTENADYVANFCLNTYTITTSANPTSGGTVSGSGTYDYGTTTTVSAMPNEGFRFTHWTKNGLTVSSNANYSFTVTEDALLVANFGEYNPGENIIQATNFAQGWNWWSSYVETDDLIEQLENGLGSNGMTIKSQNGYVQYMPSYNIWYGSTDFSVNNEANYMVQTNAECNVEIDGLQANPAYHPINLATGWNWIGYPNGVHLSFEEAFSNLMPSDGDQVKSQGHGYASYMADYGIWYGDLSDYGIDPGMGLMYKSNNGETFAFTYPESRDGNRPAGYDFAENNYWTANYHAYPNNMTVTAVVELDEVELAGEHYELAAFANGECRGSAHLMYVELLNRYMAFLTVSGDETVDLYFGLYDAETGAVETQCVASLQYETNAIVGSLGEPYIVSFRSTTGADEFGSHIYVFPNPVARGENITVGLPEVETLHAMSVQIINALGQVVESRRTTSLQNLAAPNVAGVYTLRITVEGKGAYYRKLVVK